MTWSRSPRFSSICGWVCDAPCEPACRRVDSDGAVQIRNLKRFVMDKLEATYRPPAEPVTRKQSVAIVGAGPAGLVAAHDLCVAGYAVHVYEMTDRLGGMMIWGIPAFRLPPGIIDEDVERLMQRCPGLEVHLDTALGRDVTLRRLKKEEMIDIAWFGGARSGTDAAKLVGLEVNAIGYGVALALGGEITPTGMRFAPDRNEEERACAVVNILKANAGEASMMARCAGKTRLHNIEPEDLRSITRATAAATGIPLAGTRAA